MKERSAYLEKRLRENPNDRHAARMLGRITRNTESLKKTEARLSGMGLLAQNSKKGRALKRKVKEHQESLDNIRVFGQEVRPNGLPDGVNINM